MIVPLVPLVHSDSFAERIGTYEYPQLSLDVLFGTGGDNTATIPWMALESLVQELSDPGTPFVPPQKQISITTDTILHHVYLMKHDKTIIIILWREQLAGDYEMLRRFAKRKRATVNIPHYAIHNVMENGPDGFTNTNVSPSVLLGPDAMIMEFRPTQ